MSAESVRTCTSAEARKDESASSELTGRLSVIGAELNRAHE